jgi:hypothetical protein
MAIRPVDLQLAYMAGPQNAANVSHEQNAPQAAQQAAQSAFAAEVTKREESIAEPEKVDGQKVRARDQRDPRDRNNDRNGHREPESDFSAPQAAAPASLTGGDGHLIDVTA